MIKFVIIIATCAFIDVGFADDCVPRDFGRGSIVCVCNSTYCDKDVDSVVPKTDEFLWYASSKSGLRFRRSVGIISNKSEEIKSITINATKTYQKMEGFGGAFTDAAGINIKKLSPETQSQIMRSYYGSEGCDYNLGRVPIGGTDFSTRGYSYDDIENDNLLKQFSLAKEDIDFKIPFMQQALQLNPNVKFVAAAWSAPGWMKSNNNLRGFGYLLEKHYQTYADYIVKFLDSYKQVELNIWCVSTGNEPSNALIPFFFPITTMLWTPGSVATWIVKNLRPTLNKNNYNSTQILAIDDQRFNLPWFIDVINSKYTEAMKDINGIALHYYWDNIVPARVLDATHDKYPNKFLMITEACTGERKWDYPKVSLGSWSRAERYVTSMMENFNHWVVGWIDWNLALDQDGKPNWIKNYVDAPIIVEPLNDTFYKQPVYYILKHFSKFVQRDSVRIKIDGVPNGVLNTAFKTTDNRVIIVLYNKNSRSVRTSIRIAEKEYINVELPDKSIHTLVYNLKV